MEMKVNLLGVFLAFLGSASAQNSQTALPEAEVTFYSAGSFWKAIQPGYKHGAFKGWILDDEQPLVELKSDRFATFRFLSGKHTFSANLWFNKSSKGGAHVQLNLMPGRHYYLSTYLSEKTLLVAQLPFMEQRSCQDAQKDAEKVKLLPQVNVVKEASAYLVADNSFSQCL